MNEPEIFVLLGKKLSGEATDEELRDLERLLEEERPAPEQLKALEDFWHLNREANEYDLNRKWEKFVRKLSGYYEAQDVKIIEERKEQRRIFPIVRIAGVASVAILLVISGWLLWFSGEKKNLQVTEVAARDSVVVAHNGERKTILLPDSTTVHLNSGSRLNYNKDFGKGNREVWLSGEAFFEVTKDATHPFWVNTNRMMVKVLGTVFNVKAYDTQEDIETTVVEGKVEVSLKDNEEKKVILLPNEKISVKNDQLVKDAGEIKQKTAGVNYEVKTVVKDIGQTGMPEEAVWVQGKMIFADEPFETVALKMERWYDVHIHFENEKLKTILMTGDFDRVDVRQALQILQMMVNFKYEIKENEIFIR